MRYNDTKSVVNVAFGTGRERVCTRIAKSLYPSILRQRNCAIARSSVGDRPVWSRLSARDATGARDATAATSGGRQAMSQRAIFRSHIASQLLATSVN